MSANNACEHNCGESVCAIKSPKSALNYYTTITIDLSDDGYDDNLLDGFEQHIVTTNLNDCANANYIDAKISEWSDLELINDYYNTKCDNNDDVIGVNDNIVAHVRSIGDANANDSMPTEYASVAQKSGHNTNLTQLSDEASHSNNNHNNGSSGETSVVNSHQIENKAQFDTKASAEHTSIDFNLKPVICSRKVSTEKESSSEVEIIAVKSPKKKIIRKKFDAHIRSSNVGNRRDLILIEQSNIHKQKSKKRKKKIKKLNYERQRSDNNKQVSDPRKKSSDKTSADKYQHNDNSSKNLGEYNMTPLADDNRLCASNCGNVVRDPTNSRYCSLSCLRLCVEKALAMLGNESGHKKGATNVAVIERRNDTILGIEYIAEKSVLPYISRHPNYEVFLPEYVKKQSNTSCLAERDPRPMHTKTGSSSVANYATKVSVAEQSAKKVVTENVSTKKIAETVARKCEKRVRSVDSSRKTSTELRCEQQAIRMMAKNQMNESEERFKVRKSIVDILLSRCNEAEDISVGKYRIECIAEEVEQELYLLYNKSTTQPYKHKFRSLMFNLRDPKNNHLFRQVVNREISSECLVKMAAEEMASQELAKWREKEKLASLEIMTKEAKYFHEKAVEKEKKTNLDVNVDINGNVDQIGLFSNFGGFQIVVNASYLTSSIPTTVPEPEPPKSVPKTVNVQHEVVDKILEENAKQTIYSFYSDVPEPEPPAEPPHNQAPNRPRVYAPPLHTLWQGLVVHESAKFSVNANKLSGATVDFLQDELTDTLQVCGRVAPEIVYDYVREILVCPNNEICVVMLDWNIEEKLDYDAFFNYFYHRGRYAVAKCTSYLVKNFYIIPVPRNGYVPNVFLLFNKPGLNNKFLEYLRSTQANVLVGIVITNLPNIQPSNTPPLYPHVAPQALPNHPLPPPPQTLPPPPRPTLPLMPEIIQAIAATNSVSNTDPRALRDENYTSVPMDIDDDIEIIANNGNNNNNNNNGNKANAAQSVTSFKDPRLKPNH